MEAKDIKGLLPHGAINQTAKELGVSITTVAKVVKGDHKSKRRSEILNVLVNKIIKHQNEDKELTEALKIISANQSETSTNQ